jgi:acyl-coenzyme A synthetase/AMP-(fatty) acid ligase
MTAELSDAWRSFSGTPLVVGYGQTETPTSTLTDPQADAVNGMIGAPMAGNAVTVLDENGQPAQPGALGEIAFAGSHPGLMLGYWRDGRIVAEFGRDGWHMTGDTGYLDANGCLFFTGRSDDIISSSGYRIGPTEVENALTRHPAVQECAVAASPDAERGEVVKAFVVLKEGCSGSSKLVRVLQDFVKQEIAPFKYPRRIEFVAELPRTSSGKISRRLLREAEFARGSA